MRNATARTPKAAATLEPLVTPLMLRRRVSEVARDLPERIDIPEVLELSEAEAYAYDEMREEILREIRGRWRRWFLWESSGSSARIQKS